MIPIGHCESELWNAIESDIRVLFDITLVVSYLFFQINTNNYVLYLSSAAEGIQDRCCYSEETSWDIYGSSSLVSESVNSTICTNSNSWAPYCRCSTELTSFFNNHSFLYRTGNVICYYHNVIPSGEGNNCFFSACGSVPSIGDW